MFECSNVESSTSLCTMKDLTDYFTTPRKTASVDSQDLPVRSPEVKPNNHPNGFRKKTKEKRKLESNLDFNSCNVGDQVKSKRNVNKVSKVTPNFCGNLTVVLTHIDADLPKTWSPRKKDVRVFKNVLLKDCSKEKNEKKDDDHSDVSTEVKSTKKLKTKRKLVHILESDSSDAEQSDSSAKLFKEEAKQEKAAGVGSDRRLDGNNLFNYFSKAEKKAAQPVEDCRDSPTKCCRMVKVQALVHSPPKSHRILIPESNCKEKLSRTSRPSVDDVRLPVVKIVRADFAKFNALDEIIEIGTDFVDTTTIKKSKDEIGSSYDDEGESSSDYFAPSKIQPWKMRVQFVSGAKFYRRRKKKVLKEKMAVEMKDKNPDETLRNEVDKELVVSLPRVAPGTPEKVNVVTVMSSDTNAGVDKDKPVIKKLAPLFYRPPVSKKISSKPVDIEARRLFLESGVPESIKKKMEEQKNSVNEDDHREYCFPKHNHVQQIEPTNWVWNLENVSSLTLISSDNDNVVIPEFDNIVSFVSRRKTVTANSRPQKLDVFEEIVVLKKQEPDVNVDDVFASIQKLGKVVGEENHNLCWTEKYKPSTFSDVIGNSTSLLKLKEWIESHKRTRIKLSESDDDSSDEFVDSDDSTCSVESRNNVAVLVGPSGCGKTCAVYTLSNELGFKVLEVNAASNRNGKRILDELHEATQSHRVKRATVFCKDMKKSKKKQKETEKKTMSLILIEDADILFENYDEGFLSALSSLTLHSKRPFIFTVNNLSYPHLLKYTKAQNLVLTFAYPTPSLFNVWLQSIALNEGVKLSDEVLMYLFHVAGLDLRKGLLQLQMLISSNKCHFTLNNEQLFYTNWWKRISKSANRKTACKIAYKPSSPHQLFSDDDDDDEKSVAKPSQDQCHQNIVHVKSKSEKDTDAKALHQLGNLFERIALLGLFELANSDHLAVFRSEDTVCSQFTTSSYLSQLTNDITDTLKKQIFDDGCVTDSSFSFKEYSQKIRIRNDAEQVIDHVFCHFNPKPTNTVSKYCDYLPTIRNIARIESSRVTGQRRTSRYFSYLNSINIHLSDMETNVLSNSLS